MRPPAYLTVGILAVALCMAWLNHRQLASAREGLDRLAHEVGQRESATSGLAEGSGRDRGRSRPDNLETVNSLVRDCLNLEAGVRPPGMEGETSGDPLFHFGYYLKEEAGVLNVEGLGMFISRIMEEAGISDEIRREAVSAAFYCLAAKSPWTCLEMTDSVASLFRGDRRIDEMIGKPISELAESDPMGALEWIRKNSVGPVEFDSEQMKNIVIGRVARNNPRMAFEILDSAGLKNREGGMGAMTGSLRTTGQKVALMRAAREYGEGQSDDPDRKNVPQAIIRGIAGTYAYGSFATAREWYESAGLTEIELSDMLRSFDYSHLIPSETGEWLGYFQTKLPERESASLTRSWMSSWTEDDHEAAGKWLTTAPEGMMKNIATRAYAEVIYKYQPETAIRRILTMPACEDRENALRLIYLNWPETDAEGKKAFAKEHGIQ